MPCLRTQHGLARIEEVRGLYYLCSETKALVSYMVAAQLICFFVFTYVNFRFSHDLSNMELNLLKRIHTNVTILQVPLPLCAWDGLHYLIVALPEPSK